MLYSRIVRCIITVIHPANNGDGSPDKCPDISRKHYAQILDALVRDSGQDAIL